MAKLRTLKKLFNTERESFSEYLPYRFWDSRYRCYDNFDHTIGWFWELEPLAFASTDTIQSLELILTTKLPEGSMIQFILFADPRIKYNLEKLDAKGKEAQGLSADLRDLTEEWIVRYNKHIHAHTLKGFDDSVPVPVRNYRLFCAIKIPYTNYDETRDELAEKKTTMEQYLKNTGLLPREGDPNCLLDLVRYLINPTYAYENQDWEPYNSYMEINKQVVNRPNKILWEKGKKASLMVDGKYLGIYTAGSYPEELHYFENLMLIGDIFNRDLDQIAQPFMVNVTYINHNFNKDIKQKASLLLTQRAFGLGKAKLERKKEDFERAVEMMNDEVNFNGVFCSVVTFCDNYEEKARVEGVLKSLWQHGGYNLQEETFMSVPVYLSSLPFGLVNNKKSQENLKRIDIAPASTVAEIMPVQADWKGVLFDPAFFLVSRRGQLQGMDIFKSSTNYNFAIAANSGSGKSFLSGFLVLSHLRLGDYVRIIDVGRSYYLLCKMLGGDFIEFSKQSNVNINPFQVITDIRDDISLVVPMLEKMAKPKEGCNDYEQTQLKEAILRAWDKYGERATPAKVGEILSEDRGDKAKLNMAIALQSYGPQGEYGRWFESGKPLSKKPTRLQVLELEELNNDKHLRTLVLMFIIYRNVQLMYKNEGIEGERKRMILLIDEAWDLFGDEASGAGKFIEEAYRKARKYGGAVGSITQRVADYYKTPQTEAMLFNSATWLFLKQKEEELQQLRDDSRIKLNDFVFNYMSSCKTIPGKYSEIFIKNDEAYGVGRLFVDPFTYAMLTTEPGERAFINNLLNSGYGVKDALIQAADTKFGKNIY